MNNNHKLFGYQLLEVQILPLDNKYCQTVPLNSTYNFGLVYIKALATNRTNLVTNVAILVDPAHIDRTEAQVVRVERIALVERTRPIVAIGTDIAACRRQEYAVSVGFTGYFVSLYSIFCGPSPSAIDS